MDELDQERRRAPEAFDRVYARALEVWQEEAAKIWLVSQNGFLNGARPIDVLRVRGTGDVLDALEATVAGAYA